jgi:hypothetical protein
MEYWPYIKECIVLALPPYVKSDPENILRIQEKLLVGTLECWGLLDPESGQLYGVMTTQIVVDDITGTKNLLIFSLTLTEEHEFDIWNDGYEAMMKYAKFKQCTSIMAYTNRNDMKEIAMKLGGDVEWSLINFPLYNM